MKLLLFDIDGTLLQCGRQVGVAFLEAMQVVYGEIGSLRGVSFAGRTDPAIVLDILRDHQLSREEILGRLPRMRELYVPRLDETLHVDGMRLLPGVRRLLTALAERDDVALGLITGNWEGGARVKLSRFELNEFFAFGAFGDDGVDRAELPPVAVQRAQEHHGVRFAPEDVLIIGDTVHDVTCAQAHDHPVLGVTTGHATAEQLRKAGADWIAESLALLPPVPHLAD
ncbi:MAG: HAD hydrolase-like protein [Acidobacteriota bacterium]